ncbi:cupin domain-containing protein [Peptoniphilus catoniae]|uniref:cupin domain-containing protein n=1 Tax=Peptoniphilus catoniae TaxID=1660341 RepID=UPI0010FF5461|nr:cupin domain-containing protein [Peptoniphilus catoniae]
MKVQSFSWGYVNWVIELSGSVNIGISHIYPGAHQKEHTHYGNEQYIFVLQGEGLYGVNGEERVYRAGEGIYFPRDALHSTTNLKDQELIDLCVSVPISFKPGSLTTPSGQSFGEAIEIIVKEGDLDFLNFPLAIFNDKDEAIYFNGRFAQIGEKNFRALKKLLTDNRDIKITEIKDHKIISKSIYKDRYFGKILAGYYESSKDHEADQIFKGSIESMCKIVEDLARSIESFLEFNSLNKKLKDLSGKIRVQEEELNLKKDELLKAKDAFLDTGLNARFILTALNVLAYETVDNKDLYNMIVDLSKTIRYVDSDRALMESIKDQMGFVNSLINFYSKRYMKSFSYRLDLDEELKNLKLPSNLFMPLVENAFVHGFDSKLKDKILAVNIKKKDKGLYIEIINNGRVPDINSLLRINKSIREGEGGLNLIYRKLKKSYKDFSFAYKVKGSRTVARVDINENYIS